MNPRSLRFRMTAWYAGLLASALLLFGVFVYAGLERYLDFSLQKTLTEQSRSIGTQLLASISSKRPGWLASEINEAYAPDVNGHFIRVTGADGEIIYLSGPPKDNSFDPSHVPLFTTNGKEEYLKRFQMAGGHRLFVKGMVFTNPDGSRFLVESGAPYDPIENILHGLLVTVGIYMPLVVSLAIGGGYWLMRRSLQPVDEITNRAEGITSTNLSERLPTIKTGDELERLSTALNRMIARLDEAFQHINRFSADASHELRTPLTILQLELEGIVQHYRLDPELVDQIGSALEETHRLSRIVENLLAISRLDAGQVQVEKMKFDLGELTVSTVDQMKLLAEEKLLSMHCHAAAGVYIEADHARLKQVIVNLIDNAIKYTPPGGEISIDVYTNQNLATVEVSDSGVGIPAEVLPHVFERFYRADKARSRDSGGAGLGLAIVKAICTALGAEIKIASTEGAGSSFMVKLPLAPSQGGESPDTTRLRVTVPEERS